jgi:hypothetical protein
MTARIATRSRTAVGRWFDTVPHDVRLAPRLFRLNPVFATTAVVTLALGIAATTGVVSIVDATLLRPLPFPSPDRVVYVGGVNARRAAASASWGRSDRRQAPLKSAAFGIPRTLSDALRESPAFESVTEYAPWVSQPFTAAWADLARVVNGVNVSPDFFTVFRVRPARGRPFTGDDENVAQPEVRRVTRLS